MNKPHNTPHAWFYPRSPITATVRDYNWIKRYIDGAKGKAT